MKKRMVAMLLGMSMIAASLAGCGKGAAEESSSVKKEDSSKAQSESSSAEEETPVQRTDAEIAADAGIPEWLLSDRKSEVPLDKFAGTELDIAIFRHHLDPSGNFDEKPFNKIAEAVTGIHINWEVIDSSVAGERTSAMLASGDLPDAMMGLIDYNTLVLEKDMFYNFAQGDLLETYAADVLEDYELGGQGVRDYLTMADGEMYSFAGNVGSDWISDGWGIWWINKAWLDKAGLDVPTNAEEFYEAMCAFRDNDMNGNGDATDEIPLTFCDGGWDSTFINYANAFGIAGRDTVAKQHYYMIEDGKVIPTADTEAYRAFLEYFHKLSEAGCLDPEGFSQTYEQWNAKLADNKVGVFVGWSPDYTGAPEDWVVMNPFEGFEGVEVKKTGTQNGFYGNLTALVASADTEKVEALLHWWNFLSSNMYMKNYCGSGDMNVNWYVYEDGSYMPQSEYEKLKDPEVDYDALMSEEAIGNSTCPYISPYDDETTYAGIKGSLDGKWIGYNPDKMRHVAAVAVFDTLLPVGDYVIDRMMDPSAAEVRNEIEVDLISMINSFCATSVVDGVTDDTWNDYLEDLETYRYYEWIDWYQGYVDKEY